jgi:hypothetical protein
VIAYRLNTQDFLKSELELYERGTHSICGKLELSWLKSEIVKATAVVEIIDVNLQLFSAHETTQGHLVIVFSNGVRVTFYITPSQTTAFRLL